MPVIPASQEARAGELLEPGKQRLQLSPDCATVLQPGKPSKTLSPTKKKIARYGGAPLWSQLLGIA